MIPGDLLSAFPHRQFHTLPGLLDSWAALPNSNPNACMPMQGGSLYHFYDGLWYDPAERSQPTVREADTLPTEPTRHGRTIVELMTLNIYRICIASSRSLMNIHIMAFLQTVRLLVQSQILFVADIYLLYNYKAIIIQNTEITYKL